MALIPVSDLVATSSDIDTIGLAWSNPDIYDEIYVFFDKGAGWEQYTILAGTVTSVDVDDIVSSILYNFKIECTDPLAEDPDAVSNTDSAACWVSTPVATVNVLPNIEEYVTGTDYTETPTATINVTGVVLDAISLKTTYGYYVGSSNGKVYEYSASYKSDAGTSISARWESKDTDFADQSIEISDRFKTIEFVRLHYIDKTSSATVSVLVSTDGGATWTPQTKSIGTGDGKGKTKDFHFITTGQIFRFAVENASTSDEFQFAGLEVFYSIGGSYFEV